MVLSPSSPNHAVLGDEVEREPYRAGGIGARTTISSSRCSPRPSAPATGAKPVPDDGVAALVEPVVRGGDVSAPGGSAGILARLVPPPAPRRATARATTSAVAWTRGPGTALVYDRAGALCSRVPARAGGADSGLVHAPGGQVAPPVPGATREARVLDLQEPRSLRRGHLAAGRGPRGGCGRPLRGHHAPRCPRWAPRWSWSRAWARVAASRTGRCRGHPTARARGHAAVYARRDSARSG